MVLNESKGEREEKRRSISLFVFSLLLSLSLVSFWKEAIAGAIGTHNLVYHRLPFTSRALEVVTGARPYIPRTHAKKTGKDSRREEDPACMFGFPTVFARDSLLLRGLAPAFADGQTEAVANFKDSRSMGASERRTALSLSLEWYTHIITMPA